MGTVNSKGSKNAFIHGTGQIFRFPPKKLVIIGYDTKDTNGSHELWRADASEEAPKYLVDSIRKHGVLQPGKCRKIDEETAEVVMGRDRTKACRVLEAEGIEIFMPMLVWPKGASLADIIGAANAENYGRKTESIVAQTEHVFMQLKAEGYFDGTDEAQCINSVSASTGMSAQRIRNLILFRDDAKLVKAVEGKKLRGEAALALATLEDPAQRETELAEALKNPDSATTVEIRERVAIKKRANKAKKAAAKPAKKSSNNKPPKESKGPGLSKALMRRIVESEMKKPTEERHLDPLVIKAFKGASGLSAPDQVPGLMATFKDLGLAE